MFEVPVSALLMMRRQWGYLHGEDKVIHLSEIEEIDDRIEGRGE